MTTLGLAAIISLAVAGVATLILSVVTSAIWRTGLSSIATLQPRTRAQVLMTLRLGPAFGAIAIALFAFIAFIRLEPANQREVLGFALPILAAVTCGAFALRIGRAVAAWRDTERTIARWTREGTGFPTVAVVGIWQPQLYVARQVLAACDEAEIDAMIAHEIAHVSARDNLTRFLFLSTPFVSSTIAGDLEQAWAAAADEAADDEARRDEHSALALASALTKVARLAIDSSAPTLHASAILSGGAVERRVRRLLDAAPHSTPRDLRRAFALSFTFLCAAGLSNPAQRVLYEAAEYCVRHLF